MTRLADRKCQPCEGGVPPLEPEMVNRYLEQLNGWTVTDGHLTKDYKFPDFLAAMAFANRVGMLAEEEGHHPDLHITYGRVTVELWTHKIGGLTDSDFILAAKIDETPQA